MVDSHGTVERGGAVQCALLTQTLAQRGHKITCIFDGSPRAITPGVAFKRLVHTGVEVRFYHLLGVSSVFRFRRKLFSALPDVIHTHKNRALRFVYAASLGRQLPPWVANRGTIYPLVRGTLAHRIHYRHVDRIVAVSRAVRETLVRDHIPSNKIEVVYGSFDAHRFHPAVDGLHVRKHWGVPRGVPLIGTIASLRTPKKGHKVFLDGAARLLPDYPNARFVLVGEGNPKRLRAYAKAIGIADRVIFAGFVEEVPEALAAIDVVVCASLRGEGLTGTMREALAMERPVVSTDVAGNREIVRPDETGFLVPVGDSAALATAVSSLLKDPAKARALAAQGRALVLGHCTNEVRADRIEQLYWALLENRKRTTV